MATKSSEKLFIDTNILIYSTNRDSIFFSPVYDEIWKLWEEYQFCISTQVLREYIRAATSSVELTSQEYKNALNEYFLFQQGFEVLGENELSLWFLNKLLKRYSPRGKQIHDANIVATMLANGVERIYTHNVNDFKRYSAHIKIHPLTLP